jgi:hypothetical protein
MMAQMKILHPEFDPDSLELAPGFDAKNLTSRDASDKVSKWPWTQERFQLADGKLHNSLVCSAARSLAKM